MAKASGFVYRGNLRTTEDVARRAKHSSGLYDSAILDGFTPYKPKEGENIIRILPFTWTDVDKWGASWEIFVWVHNNIGPDRGTFICLNKMKDEPCSICEARRSAVDDEERYALAPNERALCWLIDRKDEKTGPQWWMMPIKTVFKVINARSTDKKTNALLLIDDPEEGFDVFFDVEGAGKKTASYTGVEIDRDPTPVHQDEKLQARWLNYVTENPLPELLNIQDHDYIEKVLMGRVSKKAAADDGADDSKSEPRTARRRPAASEEEPEAAVSARMARRRPVEAQEEGSEPEAEEATPGPTRARRRPEPETEAEAEPEADARPAGRRRSSREEPPAEEAVEDEPPARTTRRRSVAAEPDEEEIPPESHSARAGLEKLRPGARR